MGCLREHVGPGKPSTVVWLCCVQGCPTHDQGGSLQSPWLALLDIWCREQKYGVTWLFWTGEGPPKEAWGFSLTAPVYLRRHSALPKLL